MSGARPGIAGWLYQGIRPRWIPLRWWTRAFTDGYRAACADVTAGFVDPASPDKPWPSSQAGDVR